MLQSTNGVNYDYMLLKPTMKLTCYICNVSLTGLAKSYTACHRDMASIMKD